MMIFSSTTTAVLTASWLLVGSQVAGQVMPTATVHQPMNALTAVGCFNTAAPMSDHGPYTFQSKGNCQEVCYQLQQPVMGLVNGTNCWCGALIPPNITQVADSNCNTPCGGIDTEFCGGANFWTVYLTGITRNHINNLDPASMSASSKTSSTGSPSSTDGSSKSKGGSNTIGIAVGVVVGLLVLCGIAGGIWFWLRFKRIKAESDEYKRQNDMHAFVHGGKTDFTMTPTTGDSRLDPDALGRRQSSGSIADNQDYSRRILQVRNPDGF